MRKPYIVFSDNGQGAYGLEGKYYLIRITAVLGSGRAGVKGFFKRLVPGLWGHYTSNNGKRSL
jgi:hypothetical protein